MGIRVALSINVALWIVWLGYWAIAARGAKPVQWREPLREQWSHNALALLGAIVLSVSPLSPPFLHARFLPLPAIFAPLGTIVTALGLGVSVAARIQLGGNWSAAVEIKDGHALIRHGLYRHVRHPIYSGLLLGLLGSTIAIGQWRELLGLAVILAALILKARHEENLMRRTFPDYDGYARETAALIPFLL